MARKVSGTTNTILVIGALGIGGYLLYKLFNGGALSSDTSQNNQSIDQNTQQSANNDVLQSQSQGVQQSLPDSTLNGYATTLFQMIGGAGGNPTIDDDTAANVYYTISNVRNNTDWFRLVQLFGTKRFNSGGSFNTCALFGYGCDSYDLPGLLRLVMPTQRLADINSYFSEVGITARL